MNVLNFASGASAAIRRLIKKEGVPANTYKVSIRICLLCGGKGKTSQAIAEYLGEAQDTPCSGCEGHKLIATWEDDNE